MLPLLFEYIDFDTAFVQRYAPFRFVSITVFHSDSGMRGRYVSLVMPALFTRMSIEPHSESISATRFDMDSPSDWGHSIARALQRSAKASALAALF